MRETKIRESTKNSIIFGWALSESARIMGNNIYLLEELNGESTGWGPVNDRFLKHYLVQ
jgi:hypothetical protein